MNNGNLSYCETCSHYDFDETAQEYFCNAALDEDDMAKLMSFKNYECPYFDFYDEYKIVRKQN